MPPGLAVFKTRVLGAPLGDEARLSRWDPFRCRPQEIEETERPPVVLSLDIIYYSY